jgi:hypothetical protein
MCAYFLIGLIFVISNFDPYKPPLNIVCLQIWRQLFLPNRVIPEFFLLLCCIVCYVNHNCIVNYTTMEQTSNHIPMPFTANLISSKKSISPLFSFLLELNLSVHEACEIGDSEFLCTSMPSPTIFVYRISVRISLIIFY